MHRRLHLIISAFHLLTKPKSVANQHAKPQTSDSNSNSNSGQLKIHKNYHFDRRQISVINTFFSYSLSSSFCFFFCYSVVLIFMAFWQCQATFFTLQPRAVHNLKSTVHNTQFAILSRHRRRRYRRHLVESRLRVPF